MTDGQVSLKHQIIEHPLSYVVGALSLGLAIGVGAEFLVTALNQSAAMMPYRNAVTEIREVLDDDDGSCESKLGVIRSQLKDLPIK